jgi:hypothetical protein
MQDGISAILLQAVTPPIFEIKKQATRKIAEDSMKKYMIEREIPKVGTLEREQLREAAAKSNDVLRQLGTDIQWVESYVTNDKMFCVYLAEDEALIHRHAEVSGFPATRVTEIGKTIDPTTAVHR